MASILKVNQIQHTNGTSAITIDSSGVASGKISGPTLLNSGGISMNTKDEADFLNLPAGISRFTIMFNGLTATSGDASALIRLGTTSGLTTSGYVSTSSWGSSQVQDTSGFIVYGSGGSNTISGICTICHMGNNIYVSSHAVRYNSSNSVFGGGHVTIGATVDRLRVQGVSGGTFDGGSVNMMYEL